MFNNTLTNIIKRKLNNIKGLNYLIESNNPIFNTIRSNSLFHLDLITYFPSLFYELIKKNINPDKYFIKIMSNIDIVLKLLFIDIDYFNFISEDIRNKIFNDFELHQKIISNYPEILDQLLKKKVNPDRYFNNIMSNLDFVKILLLRNIDFLDYLSRRIYNEIYDDEILVKKILQKTKNLELVSDRLKQNEDIVRLAINMSFDNLKYAKIDPKRLEFLRTNVIIPLFHSCTSNEVIKIPKNILVVTSSICGISTHDLSLFRNIFIDPNNSYLLRNPIKNKLLIEKLSNTLLNFHFSEIKLDNETFIKKYDKQDEINNIDFGILPIWQKRSSILTHCGGIFDLNYLESNKANFEKIHEECNYRNFYKFNRKNVEDIFKYSIDKNNYVSHFKEILKKYKEPFNYYDLVQIYQTNPELKIKLSNIFEYYHQEILEPNNQPIVIYQVSCRNPCNRDYLSVKPQRQNSLEISQYSDTDYNIQIIKQLLHPESVFIFSKISRWDELNSLIESFSPSCFKIFIYILYKIFQKMKEEYMELELDNIKVINRLIQLMLQKIGSHILIFVLNKNLEIEDEYLEYLKENNDKFFEVFKFNVYPLDTHLKVIIKTFIELNMNYIQKQLEIKKVSFNHYIIDEKK